MRTRLVGTTLSPSRRLCRPEGCVFAVVLWGVELCVRVVQSSVQREAVCRVQGVA